MQACADRSQIELPETLLLEAIADLPHQHWRAKAARSD
jgi:hypothetical protein